MLTLIAVTKTWPNGQAVLNGVDLELAAGEVVAVAGGNGAGKTTLLRIAAGMILPDAGRVLFDDRPVADDPTGFRRSIGVLSAGDRGLYARLTVRRNLEVWAGMCGVLGGERRSRIDEVTERFQIGELADRRADRLSLGQRQRVRLAMTFVQQPRVVLLDEPRTSLDDAGTELLAGALERLRGAGGCALWASPERDEPLATQRWVLEGGTLQRLDGGTDEQAPGIAAAPELRAASSAAQ